MPRYSPSEPDLTAFAPVIASAVRAFGTDVDYATTMAAKAHVILVKRATWTARQRIREGEAAAREECATAGTFVCEVTSPAPCGTTTACRYAAGELRDLDVPDVPLGPMRGGKVVERPQPGPDGVRTTYNSESAVLVLREQLEVLPRRT
jgi:hypothetical protein